MRDPIRRVGIVGAPAVKVGAQEHAALTAWISHLPQVAATALEGAIAEMRGRIVEGRIREVEDEMRRARSWFVGEAWK